MKKLLLVPILAATLLALLAAPAFASAKTIVLSPSRSGNDTARLQAAFTAAGRGGTVQLTSGHFTINDILVTGFRGTFRGAGQGRTVIDCPPDGVTVRTVDIPPLGPTPTAFLLGFQDSAVKVADLSFDITPPNPAQWPDGYDALAEVVCSMGDTCTAMDRVAFSGGPGDQNGFFGANTDQSVLVVPDTTNAGGLYTAQGCTFATSEGYVTWLLSRPRIDLQDNTFASEGIACALIDISASQATVADNRFQNGNPIGNPTFYSAGVTIEQDNGLGLAPSRYLVSDNCFKVGPPADAVDLFDFGPANGEGQLLKAVVCDNSVVLRGSLSLPFVQNPGGIGEYYAQNVSVLANRFAGTGAAAIYLGTSYIGDDAANSVSGWKIIGNDVRGVTALPRSAGGPGAAIWLGPGTTDCTVIGGPAPTYVFNQGADNTLINVTPTTDPPDAAATPSHALKQLKRLKGMMR
jgi:hypothetical protein